MKKLLIGVMLVSRIASADEAFVLSKKQPVERSIAQDDMLYALVIKAPCSLGIANAENLRMAAIFNNPKKPDAACWGITMNPTGAEVVVISAYGKVDTLNLLNMVKVNLKRDGSGSVVGPAMTMEDFQRNIRKYQESQR